MSLSLFTWGSINIGLLDENPQETLHWGCIDVEMLGENHQKFSFIAGADLLLHEGIVPLL